MINVLPDIQRTPDTREVYISRVGVTGIKLPIRVRRHPGHVDQAALDTVGVFEVACSLSSVVKGTHMSRFTEVLNSHVGQGGVFSIEDLQQVALQLTHKMESHRTFIKLELDYFVEQAAPVSGRPGTAPLKGILEVECSVTDPANPQSNYGFVTHTGVRIQGKTCCPCSREISEFDHETGKGKGAHAQRSNIVIRAQHAPESTVWFEELVHASWRAFSQPIYPVLKRPDERHITMGAYDNPKFVEDVVRDISCQLRQMPKVKHFEVRVQNEESIHYHDAFAEVSE